jgi:hypothetical protein
VYNANNCDNSVIIAIIYCNSNKCNNENNSVIIAPITLFYN